MSGEHFVPDTAARCGKIFWERRFELTFECPACGCGTAAGAPRRNANATWLFWDGTRLTGIVREVGGTRDVLYIARQRDLFGWRELTDSKTPDEAFYKVEHSWGGKAMTKEGKRYERLRLTKRLARKKGVAS